MNYTDILYEVSDEVAVITINRPNHGNMLRPQTALELADALRGFRSDHKVRVAILTGAGNRFFCIGGEHEKPERVDYSAAMPVVDVYELLDSIQKPIIAAVNGYAVGGGQVLQLMCDLSIADESAVFRQVGPLVGSFDAGYGSWYLEEAIGRRRAKEMWMLNHKYSAEQALRMGLVNEVVASGNSLDRSKEIAIELKKRGPQALAGIKAAFSAKHTGVVGQSRIAHDLLLTTYRLSEESSELSDAFSEHREPDASKFNQ